MATIQDGDCVFRILKPILDVIFKTPSIELVESLKVAMKHMDRRRLHEKQTMIACPFIFHLDQKTIDADLRTHMIEALSMLLETGKVTKVESLFGYYNIIVSQCTSNQGDVTNVPEELKLSVVNALKTLFSNISVDCVDEVYPKRADRLSVAIAMCLKLANKEKLRKLQGDSIHCLRAVLQLDDLPNYNRRLRLKVLDFLVTIMPGVFQGLLNVILNEKKGFHVITLALKLWGDFLTAIFDDDLFPIETDDSTANSENIKKPRSKQWLEKTIVKVKQMITAIQPLKYHDNEVVRLQLLDVCQSIIKKSPKNLRIITTDVLEVIVTLSEDDYKTVHDYAGTLFGEFLVDFRVEEAQLVDMIQEKFYQHVTQLPQVVKSGEENKQRSAMRLLVGYVKIFESTNFQTLTYCVNHFERMLSALIFISELEPTEISLLEQSEIVDLHRTFPASSPWKKYKYLRDDVSSLLNTLHILGAHVESLEWTMDFLMCKFRESNIDTNQLINLMNEVMSVGLYLKSNKEKREVDDVLKNDVIMGYFESDKDGDDEIDRLEENVKNLTISSAESQNDNVNELNLKWNVGHTNEIDGNARATEIIDDDEMKIGDLGKILEQRLIANDYLTQDIFATPVHIPNNSEMNVKNEQKNTDSDLEREKNPKAIPENENINEKYPGKKSRDKKSTQTDVKSNISNKEPYDTPKITLEMDPKITPQFVDAKISLAESVLEIYLDPVNWYQPIQTDFHTPATIKTNIIQMALLTEGVGQIAHALGPHFDKYLIRTLYYLLERSGSSHPTLSAAGVKSLQNIADIYNVNVVGLLKLNQDYVSFPIVRKLRRVNDYPHVLDALNVIMQTCYVDMQACLLDIVRDVLLDSFDSYQRGNLLAFLTVFRAFVKSAKKHVGESNGNQSTEQPIDVKEIDEKIERTKEEMFNDLFRMDENDEVDDKNVEEMFKEYEEYKNEASSSDETFQEPTKRDVPAEIQIVVKVLERCRHILPSNDTDQKLVAIEILTDGIYILRNYDDELLPLVHAIWSPLVNRFKTPDEKSTEKQLDPTKNALIIHKSLLLLKALAETSKDFIRHRFCNDVLDPICRIVRKTAVDSRLKDQGSAYRYSHQYKLQLAILTSLGTIVCDCDVADRFVRLVCENVFVYLSRFQPVPLQEACLKLYRDLAGKFSDVVRGFFNEREVDDEFVKNVGLVKSHLGCL